MQITFASYFNIFLIHSNGIRKICSNSYIKVIFGTIKLCICSFSEKKSVFETELRFSLNMLRLFSPLRSLLKLDKVWIDSNVSKLHYKATVLVFLTASLLVTSRQYIGDPIDCIVEGVPGGKQFTSHKKFRPNPSFYRDPHQTNNNYCLVTS